MLPGICFLFLNFVLQSDSFLLRGSPITLDRANGSSAAIVGCNTSTEIEIRNSDKTCIWSNELKQVKCSFMPGSESSHNEDCAFGTGLFKEAYDCGMELSGDEERVKDWKCYLEFNRLNENQLEIFPDPGEKVILTREKPSFEMVIILWNFSSVVGVDWKQSDYFAIKNMERSNDNAVAYEITINATSKTTFDVGIVFNLDRDLLITYQIDFQEESTHCKDQTLHVALLLSALILMTTICGFMILKQKGVAFCKAKSRQSSDKGFSSGNGLVNVLEKKVFFLTRINNNNNRGDRRKSSINPQCGPLSFICPSMDNNNALPMMTPIDNFTAFDFSVVDETDIEIDTKKIVKRQRENPSSVELF